MLAERSASKPQLNGVPTHRLEEGGHEHAWMESVSMPVFSVDMSQHVLAWNSRTTEITGIQASDIMNRPFKSVLREESRDKFSEALEVIAKQGDGGDRSSSSSCEVSFDRGGQKLPLHLKMSTQYNSSGGPAAVICFLEETQKNQQPSDTLGASLAADERNDECFRMLDNMNIPVFAVNIDGIVELWNPLMVEATGYTKEDVKNKLFCDYATEDCHRQEIQQWFQAVRQQTAESRSSHRVYIKGKDSPYKQLVVNLSPRLDRQRTLCGCIAVVTDVTDNIQHIRTNGSCSSPNEDRELRVFVDSSPVPIFVLDTHGSVGAWNSRMANLSGFGVEDASGMNFVNDFVCPEYQEIAQEFINQSLQSNGYSIEADVRTRSGNCIRLTLRATAQYDRSGSGDVGLIVFAQEVTSPSGYEIKAAELSNLIERAHAPIFGVDRDGRVNLWNTMATQLYGFTKEFVSGKKLVDYFIRPAFRELVQSVLEAAFVGNGTCNCEIEGFTASCEIKHLLVNVTAQRNTEGKLIGAVCFAQDVTEATERNRAVESVARELRQLMHTANTPIFGVDASGRINEWNNKTAEVTGYSGAEALGQHLVESFIASSFRSAVQEILQNALRGRGTSNFELELRTKTNDIRFLLVNVTTRRDCADNVVGVLAVAQDVTEACKHDRAVAAMANELRQLIDTANAPIFGIDRDGDVNEWNDKTAEITGYTKEEAFDCSLVEAFIVPSMRDSVQDVLDNALEGRGTSNYELEFRTKSNEIRHLLVNATTRRDGENNVVGVVGVAQDVTEAVQRDRAVAGMALELRQLIDTANAPIFGIDIDGNVNEWNRRTSEITGYTKEEAFDEPLVETFIAPSMQDKVQEILDSALAGNETSNYELEFVSRDGEPRFLLVNATTRRDPENIVVGVVGVAQDVTEDRKHAQALREMQYLRASQEAKVETERNMTAYFAHELRNPLGAIDSALNAMPDDLPDAAKSLISGMQLCTGFMSSIMNNLLDVRKMEEGKMKLSKSPISLKRLLNGVHKMLLPSVRPGVQFLKVCKTKGCDWVLGDAHRIQQVMTNVVTNAIKYTVTGSVTMLIEWEGNKVKFECVDTGPGIPKNEQEKLFQRFVQRGGAPGTGLGLAIAKHLVDLTGGSIRFDSDPTVKAGTTCVVLMPLALCEPPESVVEENTALIQEPITFLIIDDIKMNRMMLKRRIMKSIAPNSVLTEAATGEEALEICGKEKFDVIVADQYMEEAGGVMVGTDVVFAMRRMRIDSVIIGCSGNDMGTQFFEAGADWVWQKPMPSNAKIIQDLRTSLNKRAQKKKEAQSN